MAALLTELGLVGTFIMGLVSDIVTTIVAEPLLLIPFGLGLMFSGVGLYKAVRG